MLPKIRIFENVVRSTSTSLHNGLRIWICFFIPCSQSNMIVPCTTGISASSSLSVLSFLSLQPQLYRNNTTVLVDGKGSTAMNTVVLDVSHIIAMKNCIIFDVYQYSSLLSATRADMILNILRFHTCCSSCLAILK